jgi:hypothetical protein
VFRAFNPPLDLEKPVVHQLQPITQTGQPRDQPQDRMHQDTRRQRPADDQESKEGAQPITREGGAGCDHESDGHVQPRNHKQCLGGAAR